MYMNFKQNVLNFKGFLIEESTCKKQAKWHIYTMKVDAY